MLSAALLNELSDIVGTNNVTVDEHILLAYSYDMTPEPGFKPGYIVIPKTVKEVRNIVLLARRRKIPFTPVVYGTNVSGLAIPAKGGIVIDLKKMNRIIRIDKESMIVVVEPGVTQSQLKRELDRMDFYYPYTAGPHCGSVMCNALLEGIGNVSFIAGNQADNITSMEVVLPTGELVRVGSCAVSPYWFSAFPLPDLRGLFVGWQGTTGIVTKIGLKLIPKLPVKDLVVLKHFNFIDLGPLLMDLSRTRVMDACLSESWAAKAYHDVDVRVPLPPRTEKDVEMFTYIHVGGNNNEEVKVKRTILEQTYDKYLRRKVMEPLKISEEVKKIILARSPIDTTVTGRLGRRGGLCFVGTYSPPAIWSEVTKKIAKMVEDYGFPPIIFLRVMDWGHYAMLLTVIPYNKADKDEIEQCRQVSRALVDVLLDMGALIYKPSPWVAEKMMRRSPMFKKFLTKIKGVMDPDGIANPHKLSLP